MLRTTNADQKRPRRDAQAFACFAAAALSAVPCGGAAAIDLDGNADLITDTVASQDMRRAWQDSRNQGARTVDEADRGFAAPEGVRMGNFFIYPTISETAVSDSNIYGQAKEPVADWRFITEPSLTIRSELPRHAFDMNVFGRFMNFAEETSQNYVNYGGSARGALHIDHGHTLSLSASAARENEERSAITASSAAAEPVPVDRFRASAGLTRDAGRLYGTAAVMAEKLDFHSTAAVGGGRLDQDYRDQDLYSAHVRAGYRISPGFDFVAKVRGIRQFNEPEGPGLPDRDSKGYEISAGLAFETDPLIRWRLLGGYGLRDYDDSGLGNVASSLLEARVQWLATSRLTLTGNASREIVDEFGAEDSGRIENNASLVAEYEIRHDLFASASAAYTDADFIGSSRKDEIVSLGFGLEYFYSKHIQFNAGYTYETRDSNEAEFESDRSLVRIGGTLQF